MASLYELDSWIYDQVLEGLDKAHAWVSGSTADPNEFWCTITPHARIVIAIEGIRTVQLVEVDKKSKYKLGWISDSRAKVKAEFGPRSIEGLRSKNISFRSLSGAMLQLHKYDLIIQPSAQPADRVKVCISSFTLEPQTAGSSNLGVPRPLVEDDSILKHVEELDAAIQSSEHALSEPLEVCSPMRSQQGDMSDDSATMATQVEYIPYVSTKAQVQWKSTSNDRRGEIGHSKDEPASERALGDTVEASANYAALVNLLARPKIRIGNSDTKQAHKQYVRMDGQSKQQPVPVELPPNVIHKNNPRSSLRDEIVQQPTDLLLIPIVKDPVENIGSDQNGGSQVTSNTEDSINVSIEKTEHQRASVSSQHVVAFDVNCSQDTAFASSMWNGRKRVPRSFAQIPNDQQALFEDEKVWMSPMELRQKALANIPTKVLKNLALFYSDKAAKGMMGIVATPLSPVYHDEEGATANNQTREAEPHKLLGSVPETPTSVANGDVSYPSDQYISIDSQDVEKISTFTGPEMISIDHGLDQSDNGGAEDEDTGEETEFTLSPPEHFLPRSAHIKMFSNDKQTQPVFTQLRESNAASCSEGLEDGHSSNDDDSGEDWVSMGKSSQPAEIVHVPNVAASSMSEDELEVEAPHSLLDITVSNPLNAWSASQLETHVSSTDKELLSDLQVQRTPHGHAQKKRTANFARSRNTQSIRHDQHDLSSDPVIPATLDGVQPSSVEDGLMVDGVESVEVSASFPVHPESASTSSRRRSLRGSQQLERITSQGEDDNMILRQLSAESDNQTQESNEMGTNNRTDLDITEALITEITNAIFENDERLLDRSLANMTPSQAQSTQQSFRGTEQLNGRSIRDDPTHKRARESTTSLDEGPSKKPRHLENSTLGFTQSESTQADFSAIAAGNRRSFLQQASVTSQKLVTETQNYIEIPSGQFDLSSEGAHSSVSRSPSFRPESPTYQSILAPNIVEEYKAAYPEYQGSTRTVVRVCVYLKWLDKQGTAPHPSLWDDFIRAWASDFLLHIQECQLSGEKHLSPLEFYNGMVDEPIFGQRIITPRTIEQVFSLYSADTKEFMAPFEQSHVSTSQGVQSAILSQERLAASSPPPVSLAKVLREIRPATFPSPVQRVTTGNSVLDESFSMSGSLARSVVSNDSAIASKPSSRQPFFETTSQISENIDTVVTDDPQSPNGNSSVKTRTSARHTIDTPLRQERSRVLPWSSNAKREVPSSPVLGDTSPNHSGFPPSLSFEVIAPSHITESTTAEQQKPPSKPTALKSSRRRTTGAIESPTNTPKRQTSEVVSASIPSRVTQRKSAGSLKTSPKRPRYADFLKTMWRSANRRSSASSAASNSSTSSRLLNSHATAQGAAK